MFAFSTLFFYSKRVYFWGAKDVVPNNNLFRLRCELFTSFTRQKYTSLPTTAFCFHSSKKLQIFFCPALIIVHANMWSNISMVNLYMFILFVWVGLQLKVINLPWFCLQKRDSPMEWTESHDVALCKEVLVQNAFLARKKTFREPQIGRR